MSECCLKRYKESFAKDSTNKNPSRFQNIKTGEIFVGTRRELSDKFNVDLIQLGSLFTRNPKHSVHGWCLVDEDNKYINPPQTDRNKNSFYNFKHDHGESFCGTRQQFAKYIGVKHIRRLFRETPEPIRGWKVIGIVNDYRTEKN